MASTYERAIVISNDSDLAEPVKMVQRALGLTVAVVAPILLPNRYMTSELKRATNVIRHIRASALRTSQLPDEVYDANGPKTSRPDKWR